jgi:hypothetical protein
VFLFVSALQSTDFASQVESAHQTLARIEERDVYQASVPADSQYSELSVQRRLLVMVEDTRLAGFEEVFEASVN